MDSAECMAASAPRRFGCSHYDRCTKLVAPCCNKVYYCRFCHDENENHTLNRTEVVQLECAACDTRQKVSRKCINCEVNFGNYACLVCRLFDNENKKQFHCDGCGICRTGGRENHFHCNTCNFCLPLCMKSNHKCIVDASRQDCPICLESLHFSRIPAQILKCGHLLHTTCYRQTLRAGFFSCPLCQSKEL